MNKNLKNFTCKWLFRKTLSILYVYLLWNTDCVLFIWKRIKVCRILTIAAQNLCISTILWNYVYWGGILNYVELSLFKLMLVWWYIIRWLFSSLNHNVRQFITLLYFVGQHSKIHFAHGINRRMLCYTYIFNNQYTRLHILKNQFKT